MRTAAVRVLVDRSRPIQSLMTRPLVDERPPEVASHGPKRRRATRCFYAFACIGLLVLAGCGERHSLGVDAAIDGLGQTSHATDRHLPHLAATGNTASVNSVKLVARVQGYLWRSIKTLLREEGNPVVRDRAGTLQGRTRTDASRREGAKAALVNAQAEFTRQEVLQSKAVSTAANLDRSRASRDTDQANVLQAQANRESAEINLSYTTVSAPFDGVVTARKVSVGELVGGDQPNELATIVQLRPIWVQFNLSEREVQRVRAAMNGGGRDLGALKIPVDVGLQTESGYPHQGVLDYANPSVDQSTGTLQSRGAFENADGALLPGYFVRVRVSLRPIRALLVPEAAIGSDQGGRYVSHGHFR